MAIIFNNEKCVIFLKLLILLFCIERNIVTTKPLKSSNIDKLNLDESRLTINVRNNGGEVFREVIRSNVNENWIGIEFRETDGSIVKQIIDFRNKLQLFSLTRLGEQDLGERRVQTFCFLTSLPDHEYISAESMSQLTQRNPAAIRQAEFDSGTIQLGMDVEIVPTDNKHGHASFALFSEHIDTHCGAAGNGDVRVYGTENDLRKWAQQNVAANQNFAKFIEALRPLDKWNRKPDAVVTGSGFEASSSLSRVTSPSISATLLQPISSPSPSPLLPVFPKIVPNNFKSSNVPNEFGGNLSNSLASQFSSVTSRRCGDILQSIYRNLTNTTGESSIDFRFTSQFGSNSNNNSNSSSGGGSNNTNNLINEKICQCSMSLVIPFYPCDIKYCTAQDTKDSQKINRFRCGIKTCRRKYDFLFTVLDKLSCLTSFDPTVNSKEEHSLNSLTHLDDENEIPHLADLNSEQKSDILQNN